MSKDKMQFLHQCLEGKLHKMFDMEMLASALCGVGGSHCSPGTAAECISSFQFDPEIVSIDVSTLDSNC